MGLGGQALASARSQIAAAQAPIEEQIAAERQANLARAQQQMGFAKAAAAILQNIAPQVSQNYSNAANADAGYARGLGNAVQAPVNAETAKNNAFLKQTGAPAGALHTAAPVGDVAYGLEGYIPATTLQREGAAFGSAAAMLPSYSLRQGQQAAGAALADTSNIAPLQTELAKTAATLPSVYQSILSNLENQQYRKAELGQAQQRIGISQQNADTSSYNAQLRAAYDQASLGFRAANLKLAQRKAAFSIQQAIAKGQMPDSALSKIYGYVVDNNGDPILHHGKRIKVISGKGGLPGGGGGGGLAAKLGLTPNEYHSWLNKAGDTARATWGAGLHWRQALAQELTHGVPRPIAIKALREQGYMPGVRGAPKISSGEGGGNPTRAGLGTGLSKSVGKALDSIPNAVHRALATRILGLAQDYIGTPYVYGGESPKGFDCSGFAQYLYRKVGINIPRTTYDQWKTGFAVPKSQLEPGDLVFFKGSDSRGGLPGHVGLYIGGDKMIDAPHTGSHVRIESVSRFGGYQGARRYG